MTMKIFNNFLKSTFLTLFLFSCAKSSDSSFFNSRSEKNIKSLDNEITSFVKANYEGFVVIESHEFINENYSAFSLQLSKGEVKESILVVINLDEKFEVIRIDNDIHFVDLSGDNKVELVDNDGSLAHTIESNSKRGSRKKREKIVFKCNGSCCFITQITDTHFSCDCPDAAVDYTISVGENCNVTMEKGSSKK